MKHRKETCKLCREYPIRCHATYGKGATCGREAVGPDREGYPMCRGHIEEEKAR